MSSDRPAPIQRAQSHQTGTITNHWNDLPSGYIPSPAGSRTVSRNASTTNLSLNPPAGAIRQPSPLKSVTSDDLDQSNGESNDVNSEEGDEIKSLETLLPALYNLPTTLTKSESTQLQGRINKFLLPVKGDGGVTEAQRLWLRELLQKFIVEETLDGKETRDQIVTFMRQESGVAAWMGSVRRVVECVVPKGGG